MRLTPTLEQEVYSDRYTPTSSERNFEIWESIYNYREKIADSPFLAAREKYLFARADVSQRGFLGFAGQLIWQPIYQIGKVILPSSLLEQGSKPVSRPSLDQLMQGVEGAIDGLNDYIDGRYKNTSPENDTKKDMIKQNNYRDYEIKEFRDRASEPTSSTNSYDYNDVPIIYEGGGGGSGGNSGPSKLKKIPTAVV